MFELQPTFNGDADAPVKIDTNVLSARLRAELEASLSDEFRRIEVDVDSCVSFDPYAEWRINAPARDVSLFVAVGRLIAEVDALYSELINCGRMVPQRYTVTIWSLRTSRQPIIGSWD